MSEGINKNNINKLFYLLNLKSFFKNSFISSSIDSSELMKLSTISYFKNNFIFYKVIILFKYCIYSLSYMNIFLSS